MSAYLRNLNLGGLARSVRSFFPGRDKEESIGFVRFTDQGTEAEFGSYANGTVGDGEGGYQESGGGKGFMGVQEDEISTDHDRSKRNRITAWQAGWNVTNAIQVRRR